MLDDGLRAETSEFGGLIYCTECYAVVGETDECLCLVERSDEETISFVQCCGGGCG